MRPRACRPIPATTYLKAINASLDACVPLKFTGGLGGALAGRPIAIRYVDNRDLGKQSGDAVALQIFVPRAKARLSAVRSIRGMRPLGAGPESITANRGYGVGPGSAQRHDGCRTASGHANRFTPA